MTLSSHWGESVVVLSESNTVVSHPQASSAGCPVYVRPRDPRLLAVDCAHDAGAGGGRGENSGDGGGLLQSLPLLSLVTGRDVAGTFWVPDAKRNEMSLLEAMHRRTAANRTHVLLHSRPLPELQFNFSTCTGDNIDLSHDAFRLSKASMALLQLERNVRDEDEISMAPDTNSRASKGADSNDGNGVVKSRLYSSSGSSRQSGMSGKAFKDQVRNGLRSIHEEEYYLVRYRDYSAWAVRQYREIAKKDFFWGKKYVEQCFAVHVGKEPGEFIPITEAQFLFGVELMQRHLLEQVGMGAATDINYTSLSQDQFRSLGVLLGDGMRGVGVDGEEFLRRQREEREKAEEERRRAANADAGVYVAPSIFDWSPGAIKKRIDHQLQKRYQTIGRFVVRSAVLGLGVYLGWAYIRRRLPRSDNNNNYNNYSRAQRRGRWGAFDGDDAPPFVPRSLLRSVFLGPKEVFDYLLAPKSG